MDIGREIVQELIESTTPIVALYPGKFKPPHAGHFNVVEKAANIADKVIIIMSNVPKDEFTPEDSMKVWGLYEDILPDNAQIIISDKSSPVSKVFDIIKDKTQDFIVLYGKGEESRYIAIEKDPNTYSNVKIVDAGTFENLNATDLRTAIRNKDLEDIQTFLPKGIDAKKVLDIYTQKEFKPGPVLHESFDKDLPNLSIDELKILYNNEYRVSINKDNKIILKSIEESAKFNIKKRMETMNESYSQALNYFKNGDIFSKSKSERNSTLKKYNIRKQLSELYNIPFKTNILLETFTPQKAPLMNRFVDYACDRLNIDKPKVFVINSPTYSQEHKSFGGYYPQEQEIKVVVHNRNMADILRTLAHELVHHMQNLNGDVLNGEDGSNTENEANALAGVIMREFGRENPEIFE
jgi:cytidyltransferase-like protein